MSFGRTSSIRLLQSHPPKKITFFSRILPLKRHRQSIETPIFKRETSSSNFEFKSDSDSWARKWLHKADSSCSSLSLSHHIMDDEKKHAEPPQSFPDYYKLFQTLATKIHQNDDPNHPLNHLKEKLTPNDHLLARIHEYYYQQKLNEPASRKEKRHHIENQIITLIKKFEKYQMEEADEFTMSPENYNVKQLTNIIRYNRNAAHKVEQQLLENNNALLKKYIQQAIDPATSQTTRSQTLHLLTVLLADKQCDPIIRTAVLVNLTPETIRAFLTSKSKRVKRNSIYLLTYLIDKSNKNTILQRLESQGLLDELSKILIAPFDNKGNKEGIFLRKRIADLLYILHSDRKPLKNSLKWTQSTHRTLITLREQTKHYRYPSLFRSYQRLIMKFFPVELI
ncbi:MAG: hypothetical protein HRT90_10320 [Candidatus Margulisbacteria bacterium]|nr:hypothetical protein [Candidatus Margulisiibacteriota bacterium]